MGKREDAELRRLEEALLNDPVQQEIEIPELDFLPDDADADLDYDIYNTDNADVDLEEYSQQVYRQERSGSGLFVLITMLCMILLSAGIFLLMKLLGLL